MGLVPVLRFLVEEGRPDLEHQGQGRTPLMEACASEKCSRDIVQCLLENHADINGVGETGWTPLHLVADNGRCNVARLLLSHKDVKVEATNERGETPLHVACWKGNTNVVELLLSKGANPNAAELIAGQTPLVYAIGRKRITCAQALIEAKVDLNANTVCERTALHYAVLRGNVAMVDLLLKAKADWSATDHKNRKPVEVVKARHRKPVGSLFVDTLTRMVQDHEVFRRTILRGMTEEKSVLKNLQRDVVTHIADFCDVPLGDALGNIVLELERLRQGRHGRKRKHSD